MYGYESWSIKKAEHWKISAFELWCWRRLLRVPWTTGRSNQSILKETSPEYSLEGLMLELKHQYFGHLMPRAESFEETLMLGKIEGGRRRGRQKMRWLDGIMTQWTWVWVNCGSWWWTGRPGVLQSMGSQRVGHDWVTELTDRLNWHKNRNIDECGTIEGPEITHAPASPHLWQRRPGYTVERRKPLIKQPQEMGSAIALHVDSCMWKRG